jgi:dephospho-CoA kinase
VVFENPGARARLEAILHPLVRSRWLQFTAESRAANTHVIVDIPLLFETNAESFFDRILTVACSRENQMARIAARGLARDQIEKIIESQLPLDQKIARSDFVVWNDGTLAILEDQAAELDLNS